MRSNAFFRPKGSELPGSRVLSDEHCFSIQNRPAPCFPTKLGRSQCFPTKLDGSPCFPTKLGQHHIFRPNSADHNVFPTKVGRLSWFWNKVGRSLGFGPNIHVVKMKPFWTQICSLPNLQTKIPRNTRKPLLSDEYLFSDQTSPTGPKLQHSLRVALNRPTCSWASAIGSNQSLEAY